MVDIAKCCQQLNDDHHLLITLSVQLCVQQCEQLEHRAAPSVSAETCCVVDVRIASIQQKLGLYKEAVDLYNSVLQQSPDYVPALQGQIFSICQQNILRR